MGLFCKKYNEEININQVYKHADELLYKAKKAGRNMLQIHS
jgi:PleD family two-component response regulator